MNCSSSVYKLHNTFLVVSLDVLLGAEDAAVAWECSPARLWNVLSFFLESMISS